ncbi:glycogen synthase kinase binding protein [Brachionichthys hirsutus]|uniref:glycogen synthase kinase binding protein n=1 Tax=Brachionichthys hirsutus TaxID=412623 RepID=UPI0036044A68
MPRRQDNYLLLEQSVTVDSTDVDALVTRIGEALQLHGGSRQKAVSVSVSCLHAGGGAGGAAPAQRHGGCCMRLRGRGHRGSSRASPYSIPGSSGDRDRDRDQISAWNKKRVRVEEDEPRRLLQQLLVSGSLIQEAVRRLRPPAGPAGPSRADKPGRDCSPRPPGGLCFT